MFTNIYLFFALVNVAYFIVGSALTLTWVILVWYFQGPMSHSIDNICIALTVLSFLTLIAFRYGLSYIMVRNNEENVFFSDIHSNSFHGLTYAISVLFLLILMFLPMVLLPPVEKVILRMVLSGLTAAYGITPILADRMWNKGVLL